MDPVIFDAAAAEAWLRQPCPEPQAATRAERLGVDEESFGRDQEGFLSTIDDVLAAAPAGLHLRDDVARVALWPIPDGDILGQGALITIDLTHQVRLASLHQDIDDFAGRGQRGIPAALSALALATTQACLVVDGYYRTGRQPHLCAAGWADVLYALQVAADWTGDDIDCDACHHGTRCDMHHEDWARVHRWRAAATNLHRQLANMSR